MGRSVVYRAIQRSWIYILQFSVCGKFREKCNFHLTHLMPFSTLPSMCNLDFLSWHISCLENLYILRSIRILLGWRKLCLILQIWPVIWRRRKMYGILRIIRQNQDRSKSRSIRFIKMDLHGQKIWKLLLLIFQKFLFYILYILFHWYFLSHSPLKDSFQETIASGGNWAIHPEAVTAWGLSSPPIMEPWMAYAVISDAGVSFLSQILEANAAEKYSLSPKACQGILRRAQVLAGGAEGDDVHRRQCAAIKFRNVANVFHFRKVLLCHRNTFRYDFAGPQRSDSIKRGGIGKTSYAVE